MTTGTRAAVDYLLVTDSEYMAVATSFTDFLDIYLLLT